jgi:esterase
MRLAYSSAGSGPPMVLLHGLFGSGDNLRGLGRAFEADYTVYYPDLPNHGDSPHTESVDYAAMGEAVAGFMREHGRSPAVVVGHSMGGKVAMRIALDRPELVAALVVLDMAPRRYEPSHAGIMDSMLALAVDEVESRADADRRLSGSIRSRPVRSFLLKNLVKDDDRYRWRLNIGLLRREYERILGWDGDGRYEGPTLFVGGTESGYVRPDRDAELVSSLFPNSRIEMVEGAGHWIHSERESEVRRLLREFLDRTGARGRPDGIS